MAHQTKFMLIFLFKKQIVLVLTHEHMCKSVLIHEGRQHEHESIF